MNFAPPNDAGRITGPGFWAERVYGGSHGVESSSSDVPATAVLSQAFATKSGSSYALQFAFGTVGLAGRSPSLLAEVMGANGVNLLRTQTGRRQGEGSGLPVWATEGFSFQADGLQATVRFSDLTNPSFGSDAVLDGVSVVAVQEPGGLGLVGGLAAVLAAVGGRKARIGRGQ